MKLCRRISRFGQTCLLLWSPSRDNTLKGFLVRLNLSISPEHNVYLGRKPSLGSFILCGSIVPVLVRVPLSLLLEEYR
jgi:hypothetical protein